MCPLPIRVGVLERIVHAVGIAVEVLGAAWVLHEIVHGEEGAGDGIIDPAVHVDESVTHQMLMSGKAAVEKQGGGLSDGGPAAEMVGMDVVEPVVCETLLHVPEIILSGG